MRAAFFLCVRPTQNLLFFPGKTPAPHILCKRIAANRSSYTYSIRYVCTRRARKRFQVPTFICAMVECGVCVCVCRIPQPNLFVYAYAMLCCVADAKIFLLASNLGPDPIPNSYARARIRKVLCAAAAAHPNNKSQL